MYDLTKPIEIAEDVFWVGYVVPDDPFQCHVYLIKNGKESILIDPGSKLVLPGVLEKIVSVVPLSHIKYIIFHHQDPDITGSFEVLETLFPPGERYVVTHWRAATLLKHYQWKTPFWLVDKNDWHLQSGDRELEFIFTPYAHFPGAFVTFDKKTKTLFSSDIFGAISDTFMLFAEDKKEYYEGVELFHKHYMPSNIVLSYALDRIMEKNPLLIAPQHGSIIRKDMIPKVVDRLKKIDCGLYLIDDQLSDVFLLARLEGVLQDIINSIISSYDIGSFLEKLYTPIKDVLPSLNMLVVSGSCGDTSITWLVSDHGVEEQKGFNISFRGNVYSNVLEISGTPMGSIYILSDSISDVEKRLLDVLFRHIKEPLAINVKRELDIRKLSQKNVYLEEKAEKDPLTGIYNRRYLLEYAEKILPGLIGNIPVSVLFIDIDHFKQVNDTYGHLAGDQVLRRVADILKTCFRESDVVARYGGEEFVVIVPFTHFTDACRKAESIRKKLASTPIDIGQNHIHITVSIGVAQAREGESFLSLLKRADENMYIAKTSGRNQVVCR